MLYRFGSRTTHTLALTNYYFLKPQKKFCFTTNENVKLLHRLCQFQWPLIVDVYRFDGTMRKLVFKLFIFREIISNVFFVNDNNYTDHNSR